MEAEFCLEFAFRISSKCISLLAIKLQLTADVIARAPPRNI